MGIYDREYYQGDQIRPLRPWDNKSMVTLLIIANVVVFLANFLLTYDSNGIVSLFALTPSTLTDFKWWKFVTYGFTHDSRDIWHIVFNMFSLYFLGRSVEDRLGKWEFFRFYMLTIVVCGLVWSLLHRGEGSMLIGASGGTTAVSMLFVFFFPNASLLLYFAIPVKAWVVGIIIVVANLFQPMGSGVAYDVHLVGAGLAAAYFFGKLNFGGMGKVWRGWTDAAKRKRSGFKVHSPSDERSSRDEKESDRILDKIYREGEDSLTSQERRFLERYSKQVRRRRDR